MKKLTYLILLLSLGCSSLKKNKFQSQSSNSQFDTKEEVHAQRINQRMESKDDLKETISITIKPKGPIKLDWQKGFEGEANSVIFEKQQQRVVAVKEKMEIHQASTLKNTLASQAKNNMRQKVIKSNKFGWVSYALIAVAVLLVVFWFVKKLR